MEVILRSGRPRYQQIDLALAQLLDLMFSRIGKLDIQLNARMLLRKPSNDRWHQAVQDDVGAPQSHFADVRIGQIFQRTKALLHFIEYIDAASEQNFAMRP